MEKINFIAISSTGEINYKRGIIQSGHFLNSFVDPSHKTKYNKYPIVDLFLKQFPSALNCYVLNDGHVAALGSYINFFKNLEASSLIFSLGTFPVILTINNASNLVEIKKFDSRKILVEKLNNSLAELLCKENNFEISNENFTNKTIEFIDYLISDKFATNKVKNVFFFGGLANRLISEKIENKLPSTKFYFFEDEFQIKLILNACLEFNEYKSKIKFL